MEIFQCSVSPSVIEALSFKRNLPVKQTVPGALKRKTRKQPGQREISIIQGYVKMGFLLN